MAVNISAEQILRLATALLAGGAGAGAQAASLLAGSGFGKSTARLGAVRNAASVGTIAESANRMSATEYPNPQHTVDVTYVPGPPQMNAMLQAGVARDAARMQTLAEHNEALTKFLRPGQSPEQRAKAIQDGIAEEEGLLSYWYDKAPRKNYTPSSSAVRAIRVTPDNRVQVQWGSSPKWYSYLPAGDPQKASRMMQELVTSPSIGQALVRRSKKPGHGSWARKYFDSSYGT